MSSSLLAPMPPAPAPIRLIGLAVDWAVVCIGGLLAALVFLNVLLHAAGRDIAWAIELGELLMVWVTFLGGACASQRGLHMTITEFIDKLGPAGRRWADAAVQSLCLAMLAVLDKYGWSLVQHNWGNELTVLGWPVAVQYMGMAVGCSAMSLFVAWDLFQTLAGATREQRYGTQET